MLAEMQQLRDTYDVASTQPPDMSSLQLLLAFQAAQEERSLLYSQLSSAFRQYLNAPEASGLLRNDIAYKSVMENVTRGFAACSAKVRALEASLASLSVSRPDLAALLRRVQEGEREKLHVTVSYQALKIAMALRADRLRAQQAELKRMTERHNAQMASRSKTDAHMVADQQPAVSVPHAHPHRCSHTGSTYSQHDATCDHQEDEHDATAAECEEAVREMLQRMDRCVGVVNDVLEEIRYEIAELRQESV